MPTESGLRQDQILQLPSTTTIAGPGQVQNNFEADPPCRQQLDAASGRADSKVLTRQPADPAGRRRLALRRAGLRAAAGGRAIRCCSRSRRRTARHRLRHDPAGRAEPGASGRHRCDDHDAADDRDGTGRSAATSRSGHRRRPARPSTRPGGLGKGDWAAYGKAQTGAAERAGRASDDLQAPAAKPPAKPEPGHAAASPKPSG